MVYDSTLLGEGVLKRLRMSDVTQIMMALSQNPSYQMVKNVTNFVFEQQYTDILLFCQLLPSTVRGFLFTCTINPNLSQMPRQPITASVMNFSSPPLHFSDTPISVPSQTNKTSKKSFTGRLKAIFQSVLSPTNRQTAKLDRRSTILLYLQISPHHLLNLPICRICSQLRRGRDRDLCLRSRWMMLGISLPAFSSSLL